MCFCVINIRCIHLRNRFHRLILLSITFFLFACLFDLRYPEVSAFIVHMGPLYPICEKKTGRNFCLETMTLDPDDLKFLVTDQLDIAFV